MTRISLPPYVVSPICTIVSMGGVYVTAKAIGQFGTSGGALGLLATAATLALVVQLLPPTKLSKS